MTSEPTVGDPTRRPYHVEEDRRYQQHLVAPGLRVLDLGCGDGSALAGLRPASGVGIDDDASLIATARAQHPELVFVHGDLESDEVIAGVDGPFDVILLSNAVGGLRDVQRALERIRRLCHRDTRVVVAYHSRLWAPLLRLGVTGVRTPGRQNWLAVQDLVSLLELAGFDVVRMEMRQLLPRWVGGLGPLVNRFLATLPLLWRFALRSYVVARPVWTEPEPEPSVTIVVPCRNEAGNIEAAITRTPRFCTDMEFVFVEGHSSDDTYGEIERVIAAHPDVDIKLLRQTGKGKGDAVRAGFAAARGDILMILDADLTTPPEDMPKFYEVIRSGRGEFVMGSRLVYPMADEAMRFLNEAGNRIFSWLFSWLLNQRITDTLCGTKVLRRGHYDMIAEGRPYFGEFDPFGDFDLIFGAAKLNLRIVEVPVRYQARTYGSTQISRFRHGVLLLRMTMVAWRRLKAI